MGLSAFASVVAVLALSAPQFSERTAQQLQSEYPTWALRGGLSVAVVHTVFADPEGRVIRCDVVGVMGSERLAKYVCDRLKRTRLQPAVDSSGAPTHGKIFGMTKMALPDTEIGRNVMVAGRKPDLELTVAKLPPEMNGSLELKILVEVGASGEVAACEGENAEETAYSSAACSSIPQELLTAEVNDDGLSVPYVREMTVLFLEQAAS